MIVKNYPIKDIVYRGQRWARMQGFAGKSIEYWPTYHFIERYIQGDQSAVGEYIDWQIAIYRDKANIKETGITRRYITKYGVEEGMRRLYGSKFRVVDAICQQGYKHDKNDPPMGFIVGDKLALAKGHHRVCTLYALGYTTVPRIVVNTKKKEKLFNESN
jgi:hypothetical protein